MRTAHGRLLAAILGLSVTAGCGANRPSTTTPPDARSAARAPGVQEGYATWYGPGFAGRPTANGERFDPGGLTAAHRKLRFGTRVAVTNLENGRKVVVRINDRGPYGGRAIIDLSREAARRLDMIERGRVRVRIVPVR